VAVAFPAGAVTLNDCCGQAGSAPGRALDAQYPRGIDLLKADETTQCLQQCMEHANGADNQNGAADSRDHTRAR